MTIKPVLLSLLTSLAATAASAAVYIDVRASKLQLSNTPEIGDIGTTISEDNPSNAVTFAVGYEFTPRIALEARYTHLGDAHVYKVSPVGLPFPTPDPQPQVVTHYFYDQSTELFSVALPIKVVEHGAFSVSVVPLLHLDRSKFVFTNAGLQTLLPGPLPVIYRDTRTKLHVGGELKLAYRFNANIGATLSYSYSALEAYDAQLIGAGLEFRF